MGKTLRWAALKLMAQVHEPEAAVSPLVEAVKVVYNGCYYKRTNGRRGCKRPRLDEWGPSGVVAAPLAEATVNLSPPTKAACSTPLQTAQL